MKISRRHHYLPQFFLAGFINSNGTFAIYDCKRKRLSPKEFYPKSKFYDSRNLVELDGEETDFPEKMYTSIDDRHADLFKKIQAQSGLLILSTDELFILQEFLLTTFWRLPSMEDEFWNQYSSNPDFTRHFKIIDRTTGRIDEDATRNLIFTTPFKKSIKAAVGLAMLAGNPKTDFEHWKFAYNPVGNNICSDRPIISRSDNPKNIFEEEFIFPLTKHHLLIKKYKSTGKAQLSKPIMGAIQYANKPEWRDVLDTLKVRTQTATRPDSSRRLFDTIVSRIVNWKPDRRRIIEESYKVELKRYLEQYYYVEEEVGDTNVDLLIERRYPIEVKKNPTVSEYDRLLGQMIRHNKSYGSAIAVVTNIDSDDRFKVFYKLFTEVHEKLGMTAELIDK